jgi:glutamyl-Q tRNA(Asp) synthetase
MRWDGPVLYQSARDDAYHAALRELRRQRLVYPCACTRREIADSALRGVEGHVYPGTCREGIPAGRTARALRLDTRGVTIEFEDLLQGRVRQDIEAEVGDFIVYRADHVFAYQLAVVADDAEQGITDVARGADLLDSTPRQIYLQRLLGAPTPRYLHLPVAVNDNGEKLSKQTLTPPIDGARPLPALMEVLRFLGQQPPPELANAGVDEFWHWAIANWQIERVPRARMLPVSA